MDVPGDDFVRLLAAYVEHNARRFTAPSSTPTAATAAQPSTLRTGAASIASFFTLGFTRRPSAGGGAAPSAAPQNSAATPIKFTLDPSHLAYLEYRFQNSTAVKRYTGILPGGNKDVASASSSWFGFGKPSEEPIDDCLLRLFKFLEQLHMLKLSNMAKRTIKGWDWASRNTSIRPGCLLHLSKLELNRIKPTVLDLSDLHLQLQSVTCSNVLQDLYAVLRLMRQRTELLVDTVKTPTPTWTALAVLNVSNNRLSDIDAYIASLLSNVTFLHLAYNQFTDIPLPLTKIQMLNTLNLSYNAIGSLPLGLHLDSLSTLNLRGNKLQDLEGVQSLSELRKLDVADNVIEDVQVFRVLMDLRYLGELWVEGNPVTRSLPDYKSHIFQMMESRIDFFLLNGALASPEDRQRQVAIGKTKMVSVSSSPMSARKPPRMTPSTSTEALADPALRNIPSVTLDDVSSSSSSLHRVDVPSSSNSSSTAAMLQNGHAQAADYAAPSSSSSSMPTGYQQPQQAGRRHRMAALEDTVIAHASVDSQSQDGDDANGNSGIALSIRPAAAKAKKAAARGNKARSEPADIANIGDNFKRKIEAMKKEGGDRWLKSLQDRESDGSNGDAASHTVVPSPLPPPPPPPAQTATASPVVTKPTSPIKTAAPEQPTARPVPLVQPPGPQPPSGQSSPAIAAAQAPREEPTPVALTAAVRLPRSPPKGHKVRAPTPTREREYGTVIPVQSLPHIAPHQPLPELPEVVPQALNMRFKHAHLKLDNPHTGQQSTIDLHTLVAFDLVHLGTGGAGAVQRLRSQGLHANIFRLWTKASRLEPMYFTTLAVSDDCRDGVVKDLHAALVRAHDRGHIDDVCKKLRCVVCPWTGYLRDSDIQKRATRQVEKGTGVDLFSGADGQDAATTFDTRSALFRQVKRDKKKSSSGAGASTERAMRCPDCNTIVSEFFGPEPSLKAQERQHLDSLLEDPSRTDLTPSFVAATTADKTLTTTPSHPVDEDGQAHDAPAPKQAEQVQEIQDSPPPVLGNDEQPATTFDLTPEQAVSRAPLLTLSNPLKLYLQLHVLSNDTERALFWCPVSLAHTSPSTVGKAVTQPAEEPAYLLLTTSSIYVLQPATKGGAAAITHTSSAGDAHSAQSAGDTSYLFPLSKQLSYTLAAKDMFSLKQIAALYNSLGRHLSVAQVISFTSLEHVQVLDLSLQALHIKFRSLSRNASGSYYSSLLRFGSGSTSSSGSSSSSGGSQQSFVIATRSSARSTQFINMLIERLHDAGVISSSDASRIVNQDATWSLTALRENVLRPVYAATTTDAQAELPVEEAAQAAFDACNFDHIRFYGMIGLVQPPPDSLFPDLAESFVPYSAAVAVTKTYLHIASVRVGLMLTPADGASSFPSVYERICSIPLAAIQRVAVHETELVMPLCTSTDEGDVLRGEATEGGSASVWRGVLAISSTQCLPSVAAPASKEIWMYLCDWEAVQSLVARLQEFASTASFERVSIAAS
ncbi:Leucine-rich repeat-containing protein 72 [Sorochytrium milnesiophthora]